MKSGEAGAGRRVPPVQYSCIMSPRTSTAPPRPTCRGAAAPCPRAAIPGARCPLGAGCLVPGAPWPGHRSWCIGRPCRRYPAQYNTKLRCTEMFIYRYFCMQNITLLERIKRCLKFVLPNRETTRCQMLISYGFLPCQCGCGLWVVGCGCRCISQATAIIWPWLLPPYHWTDLGLTQNLAYTLYWKLIL